MKYFQNYTSYIKYLYKYLVIIGKQVIRERSRFPQLGYPNH